MKRESGKPDFTLLATGSELSLAMDVASELEKRGKSVRVVSMPCWRLFEAQDAAYKEQVVGGHLGQCVSIEAATSFGWHRWVGPFGVTIAVDHYGASAPQGDLAAEYGFTVDSILTRLL